MDRYTAPAKKAGVSNILNLVERSRRESMRSEVELRYDLQNRSIEFGTLDSLVAKQVIEQGKNLELAKVIIDGAVIESGVAGVVANGLSGGMLMNMSAPAERLHLTLSLTELHFRRLAH